MSNLFTNAMAVVGMICTLAFVFMLIALFISSFQCAA